MMLASFLWVCNPMKQEAPKDLHNCNSLVGYWFLRNLIKKFEALRREPTNSSNFEWHEMTFKKGHRLLRIFERKHINHHISGSFINRYWLLHFIWLLVHTPALDRRWFFLAQSMACSKCIHGHVTNQSSEKCLWDPFSISICHPH